MGSGPRGRRGRDTGAVEGWEVRTPSGAAGETEIMGESLLVPEVGVEVQKRSVVVDDFEGTDELVDEWGGERTERTKKKKEEV